MKHVQMPYLSTHELARGLFKMLLYKPPCVRDTYVREKKSETYSLAG